MRKVPGLAALGVFFVLGCMPDSELAVRELTTKRLWAEARSKARDLAHLSSYRNELVLAVQAGTTVGERLSLVDELRGCGFGIIPGEAGTLRLVVNCSPTGELDPVTASRLARVAALLRRRLPDHELSIQSREMSKAVGAVRALNERAGVPGSSLRAVIAPTPGLVVEIRPTRMESLEEVLAATAE